MPLEIGTQAHGPTYHPPHALGSGGRMHQRCNFEKADCLITIGRDSLVDGAKAMILFMANGITSVSEILGFLERISSQYHSDVQKGL